MFPLQYAYNKAADESGCHEREEKSMKKMKLFTALLLSSAMILGGCGGANENADTGAQQNSSAQEEASTDTSAAETAER